MRLATTFALVLSSLWSGLAAQPVDNLADGRSGDIDFTSFSPSSHNALAQGTFDRKPIPLSGKLMLPAGDSKVPAVVIGHTVGGVKPVLYHRWAKSLNDAGFAVFVVDSFGPRGLTNMSKKGIAEVEGGGSFLTADAFKALALLATHPRIDPGRIAFLGFSMGGITANYVIHEKFRRAVLGDTTTRFATSIGHYPSCHYNFFENKPSVTPLFLFLAEKDDWTPAIACKEYGDFLTARGYRVATQVYEGAGHGYDEDIAARFQEDASSQSSCNPLLVNLDEPLAPQFLRGKSYLVPGGDTRSVAVGVYKWVGACTTKGATLGVSPGGGNRRDDAVKDTVKALRSVLTPGVL